MRVGNRSITVCYSCGLWWHAVQMAQARGQFRDACQGTQALPAGDVQAVSLNCPAPHTGVQAPAQWVSVALVQKHWSGVARFAKQMRNVGLSMIQAQCCRLVANHPLRDISAWRGGRSATQNVSSIKNVWGISCLGNSVITSSVLPHGT